jgi:glutathione peroxidase
MLHVLLGVAMLFVAQEPGKAKPAEPPTKDGTKAKVEAGAIATSVHEFTVKDIDGKDVPLSTYKGKVLLIVNVASECGLTPSNYKALNELNEKYAGKDFVILAFPANNFGAQEPGPNEEIKSFCADKGVKFPLFAKISVKGDDKAPLYKYLTENADQKIAGDVQWNFQKYLVDRNGKVIAKFHPKVLPTDSQITEAIDKAFGT